MLLGLLEVALPTISEAKRYGAQTTPDVSKVGGVSSSKVVHECESRPMEFEDAWCLKLVSQGGRAYGSNGTTGLFRIWVVPPGTWPENFARSALFTL